MGQDNSHLKLKLQQDKTSLEAIYFGHGRDALDFEQVAPDLAVTLSVNMWNGNTSVQLMIVDAKVCGSQLIDLRNKQKQTTIPSDACIFTNQVSSEETTSDSLVVEETPTDIAALERLKVLVTTHDFNAIYFKNQIQADYYLTGGGTREQFAKFYRTIYQYPEFDVRYKLGSLSEFLHIPEILLVKMIQIFQELGFITLADGVMSVDKTAVKRDIAESKIYQELQELVTLQSFFALSPVGDIYKKLKEN